LVADVLRVLVHPAAEGDVMVRVESLGIYADAAKGRR